jgi:hypothetical protein
MTPVEIGDYYLRESSACVDAGGMQRAGLPGMEPTEH